MAGATILSLGGVTVSTTGGLAGDLLQSVINLLANGDNVTTLPGAVSNPAIPAAPTQHAVPNVLVIPSDDTGTISIPAGYDVVIYEGTGSITGGDANTVLLGSGLNYTGPAGTVLGTSGNETVVDSTPGASFAFFQGSVSLTTSGDGATVGIDTGVNANLVVTGSGDTLNLGTPSSAGGGTGPANAQSAAFAAGFVSGGVNTITVTGTNETTSITGSNNLVFVTGTDVIDQSSGGSTIVTGQGGVITLNATGGTQLVFDNSRDAMGNLINAGPATEFVVALGAAPSTFDSSAGGADTVFAVTSINYEGGAAASTLLIGGAGVATVFAGTSATLFGGTGGGTYHEGTGSLFFWGAGNASDTILGGAGTANVTVWGNNNENTTVSQLGAATGGTFVAFGQADTLNAMDARGGNAFVVVDQTLPGSGVNFAGDSTLIGSSAGGDTFAFFAETSTAAHTITIENWQASNSLFLGNFSAADSAAASQALAAGGGGATQFTLSDNTTIKFIGVSPTTHS